MISYVTLGVSDLAAAKKFYSELFADEGAKVLLAPMLAVCTPFNQEPASAGNGTMVAFAQKGKAEVDAMYNKAIALGASCDGAPGERIPNAFYGAYVKDADGNKLCFNHFMM